MRNKAEKLIRVTKPLMLMVSVMCTAWRTIMGLNYIEMIPHEREEVLRRARMYLVSRCKMFAMHAEACSYYLPGHPAPLCGEQAYPTINAGPSESHQRFLQHTLENGETLCVYDALWQRIVARDQAKKGTPHDVRGRHGPFRRQWA